MNLPGLALRYADSMGYLREGGACSGSPTGAMMAPFRPRRRFQLVMIDRISSVAARWREDSLLVALCGLLLVGTAAAQCPVNNPDDDLPPELPTVSSSTRHGEPRIPESGYLSSTAYASTYFGFVMPLPIPLEGHRIMMPL